MLNLNKFVIKNNNISYFNFFHFNIRYLYNFFLKYKLKKK